MWSEFTVHFKVKLINTFFQEMNYSCAVYTVYMDWVLLSASRYITLQYKSWYNIQYNDISQGLRLCHFSRYFLHIL